jgi:hypothetical protein
MKIKRLFTTLSVLTLLLGAYVVTAGVNVPTVHAANCTTGLNYVLTRTYTFNDGHNNKLISKLFSYRDALDNYCGKVYENVERDEAAGYCNVNWQNWWADSTAGIWLDQWDGNFSGCGAQGSTSTTPVHNVASGHVISTQIECNSHTPGDYSWTAS